MSDKQPLPIGVTLVPRSGGGTGIISISIGWGIGVMNILNGLSGEMSHYQFGLAWMIYERWSAVVPLSLLSCPHSHFVTVRRVGDVKELFQKTETTATMVRIFRTILPHYAENQERDERLIADARAFCDEQADVIGQFKETGFALESWVPQELEHHCRQLMRVALGDDLMERFDSEFEAFIRYLKEQMALNEKEPN